MCAIVRPQVTFLVISFLLDTASCFLAIICYLVRKPDDIGSSDAQHLSRRNWRSTAPKLWSCCCSHGISRSVHCYNSVTLQPCLPNPVSLCGVRNWMPAHFLLSFLYKGRAVDMYLRWPAVIVRFCSVWVWLCAVVSGWRELLFL